MNALRWPATAVLIVALATLSACGSGDDSGKTEDGGSSAAASPSAGGRQPGAGDPSQLAAIQQCLEAAGLSDALPSGGPSGGATPPSGMPTDIPSGMPTDFPSGMPTDFPSDMPTDFPSDMSSGGPGGGGPLGALQDPEVQAALEACGISLPSGPPAPSDGATG